MPSLTIFAGPNGSGKSTIKEGIGQTLPNLGFYVNADEIEVILKQKQQISFADFGIKATLISFIDFYNNSSWKKERFDTLFSQENQTEITISSNVLNLKPAWIGGYTAAIICDFIRHKLIESKRDFSFETVMSHPSKVHILQNAKKAGYIINLIFVTTSHPDINVKRVKYRVALGGHAVPEQKIRERYYRCMALLCDVFLLADTAYLYDNSDNAAASYDDKLVAQKTGKRIVLGKYAFDWFDEWVLNKLPK
jgi:predicted ABC-type ATPase